ncbi:TetR/AcrR family transcriptional regulator C-terminal domain-containing protein [Streptomyces sp. NPDC007991]|uniref:TetR/AcrR family transcriptional regulator n=1 Tax=Streptomyces sp. NPDC007991 TaxID=3364803 RepID=UPI0036E3BA05
MAKASDKAARSSVWLESTAHRRRGGKGQPSGLDRARIVEVTVRLLDAEGLAKFSMRRLAGELDVTAMSVYWYVDTKDDLLELALDEVMGEMRLPDPDADEDWRDQVRALAREYRTLLVRHRWVSALVGVFLNIGPNNLAFSRVVQHVVRRTGLPAKRLTSAISAVFQFVYGYGTLEGHLFARAAAGGMTVDQYFQHSLTTANAAPQDADVIRESQEIMAARGGDTVAEMLERDFEFALELLIAGIEAMVARERGV